jgi:AAA domain, putative AbiEii toxin, Type IV TA system
MRRRLDLAASLIGRPPVLFLDEPTTGLDPRTRNDLWQLIQDLVAEGTTVLLTTQYMEEAEHLANTIVVLDAGRGAARGTADELKDQLGGNVLEDLGIRRPSLDDVFLAITGHPTASGADTATALTEVTGDCRGDQAAGGQGRTADPSPPCPAGCSHLPRTSRPLSPSTPSVHSSKAAPPSTTYGRPPCGASGSSSSSWLSR